VCQKFFNFDAPFLFLPVNTYYNIEVKLPVSVYPLIVANIYPLIGVLFFGWTPGSILFLYWFETLIVGFFNVLKMIFAQGSELPEKAKDTIDAAVPINERTYYYVNQALKFVMIPFFIIHFGGFSLGHGIFVFSLVNNRLGGTAGLSLQEVTTEILGGVAMLFISHLLSFYINFIGKGEYKNATVNQLFSQPYARVVIMHLTLIFGMMLTMTLGSPFFMIALFVVLKMVADVIAHLSERRKFSRKTLLTPNLPFKVTLQSPQPPVS
jgi:hypothetical protein